MALTTTTLSSAVAVNDVIVNVTSATAFAANLYVLCDGEVMQISKSYVSGTAIPVQRAQDGTANVAHPSGANISVYALASDLPTPGAQAVTQFPIAGRSRPFTSYGAAGAIALPAAGTDTVAFINGTGALAMTLANPTKDMDGTVLWVVANGKAAHTLTITSGIGNGGASFDVGTYTASLATGCGLMAANGFWVLVSSGIAGATAATAGPLWA